MARRCVNCGTRKGMIRFEDKKFTVDHAGMTATVDGLSGWRCGACGEVEFDADSATVVMPRRATRWCCVSANASAKRSGAYGASSV